MKIKSIQKHLQKIYGSRVTAKADEDVLILEGEVDTWQQVVAAGKLYARKKGIRGVVNDIRPSNYESEKIEPPFVDHKYDDTQVDVAIIGAGIVGALIARELAKWNIKICLIEKEYDVAIGASSRNDGMIHPGIDLHRGYKKLLYGPRGNAMYDNLAAQLGFKLERRGAYILFDKRWQRITLPIFKYLAWRNKVPGLRYASMKEIREREPLTASWAKGGVFTPTSGTISPYKAVVAAAENAVENGVQLMLDTLVMGMECADGKIVALKTNRGKIYPKIVINAAGVYADIIAEYANDRFFSIHPRKGTLLILDKKANLTDTVVSRAPFMAHNTSTKGGGIVRTVDANMLVGPDAVEQPSRSDLSTSAESVTNILNKHKKTVDKLGGGQIITYFSGMRACTYEEDFVIEPSRKVANLIHAAGIQSPGLTAAPAIAVDIEKMTIDKLGKVEPNKNYNPVRKGIPVLSEMNEKERDELIKQRPEYGHIVCRCEQVSEGEIIDAINSPIPALTLDAIKRRVRPGMGRCQGGFCSPLVTKLIREQLGDEKYSVKKAGEGSDILLGLDKQNLHSENVADNVADVADKATKEGV